MQSLVQPRLQPRPVLTYAKQVPQQVRAAAAPQRRVQGTLEPQDPARPYASELARRGYTCDGGTLGGGAFAVVIKARSRRTLEPVAVKVMSRRNFQERGIGVQLDREVSLLQQLEHENIIALLDYWESGDTVFVLLEYCPQGDLSQVLQREGSLSEATAAYYTRQLLRALACVHDVPAVHRDVKPDNLLVTADWTLKLTDFGWAAPIVEEERRRTLSGTFQYMAPEVLQSPSEEQSDTVDSWSAGAVLFEMLSGRPLLSTFVGAGATCGLSARDPATSTQVRQSRLLREIEQLDLDRVVSQLAVSADCASLLCGLLAKDAGDRLRCYDAVATPWLRRAPVRPGAASAAYGEREPPAVLEVPSPERPSRYSVRHAYTPPVDKKLEAKFEMRLEEAKLEAKDERETATISTASSPGVPGVKPPELSPRRKLDFPQARPLAEIPLPRPSPRENVPAPAEEPKGTRALYRGLPSPPAPPRAVGYPHRQSTTHFDLNTSLPEYPDFLLASVASVSRASPEVCYREGRMRVVRDPRAAGLAPPSRQQDPLLRTCPAPRQGPAAQSRRALPPTIRQAYPMQMQRAAMYKPVDVGLYQRPLADAGLRRAVRFC